MYRVIGQIGTLVVCAFTLTACGTEEPQTTVPHNASTDTSLLNDGSAIAGRVREEEWRLEITSDGGQRCLSFVISGAPRDDLADLANQTCAELDTAEAFHVVGWGVAEPPVLTVYGLAAPTVPEMTLTLEDGMTASAVPERGVFLFMIPTSSQPRSLAAAGNDPFTCHLKVTRIRADCDRQTGGLPSTRGRPVKAFATLRLRSRRSTSATP